MIAVLVVDAIREFPVGAAVRAQVTRHGQLVQPVRVPQKPLAICAMTRRMDALPPHVLELDRALRFAGRPVQQGAPRLPALAAVGEQVAQYPGELHAQRRAAGRGLAPLRQVVEHARERSGCFGLEPVAEQAAVVGPHLATQVHSFLEHDHLEAALGEAVCGRQSGNAGADHGHAQGLVHPGTFHAGFAETGA